MMENIRLLCGKIPDEIYNLIIIILLCMMAYKYGYAKGFESAQNLFCLNNPFIGGII